MPLIFTGKANAPNQAIIAHLDIRQNRIAFGNRLVNIHFVFHQLNPHIIIGAVDAHRLHGIFKRAHPLIAQVINIAHSQQFDTQRHFLIRIKILPTQHNGGGVTAAQTFNLRRACGHTLVIFLNNRNVVVYPC